MARASRHGTPATAAVVAADVTRSAARQGDGHAHPDTETRSAAAADRITVALFAGQPMPAAPPSRSPAPP
jgi:hypothetical protein